MSIVSSPTNQKARLQLQATMDGFRSECTQWETEVTQFFGDLDDFLQTNPTPSVIATADSAHVTDDIAGLRAVVEQQTDVLTALVNALAGEAAEPSAVSPQPDDTDEVVEAFLDRVEQLQQVAASGD